MPDTCKSIKNSMFNGCNFVILQKSEKRFYKMTQTNVLFLLINREFIHKTVQYQVNFIYKKKFLELRPN